MPAFSDIFGQDTAVRWLRDAHAAGRLPHGLIFAGPVGVGKGTTAAALAALLLCEYPTKNDACGKCDACRAVAADAHPDYRVITKELIRQHDKGGKSKAVEFSIEVVRIELVERASRKSVLGRGKVFVIEQAQLLNANAQNAMLKTLEEPAQHSTIILLTHQPDCLLPTVRSRSQIVRFAPLDTSLVLKGLKARRIDPATADIAAALSEGSLGIAIKWIEDEVVSRAKELIQMLDLLIARKPAAGLAEWLRKAADAYAEKQIERDDLSSKAQASRDGLAVYLRIAAARFRQILETETDSERLEQAANCIDAIVRAEQYLDSYVTTALVLQQLALTWENSLVNC